MERIHYPQYITWEIDIENKSDALLCFNPKIAKKIPKSLERLHEAGFRFVFEVADEAYMEKFTPLYESNIGKKDNPKIFNVKNEIAQKRESGSQIQAISLYKGDVYLGGCIHRVLEDRISFIYRTFEKELDITLPINAAIVGDYLVYQKAIDLKKRRVIHGRDRNLYGLHSDVGLVQFKLSAAGIPHISTHENQIIFSREKNDFKGNTLVHEEGKEAVLQQNFHLSKEAVFVFLGTEPGQKIKQAILYVQKKDEETLKKYNYLFKNENFSTEIIEIKP
jgi:hypothetical protein